MKLLSIDLARSIWLFDINDMNPRGKSLYPVLKLLVDLYKFKSIPSQTEDFDYTKGVKFNDGEFITKDGNLVAINFTVYNDGLFAETKSSTKDTDDFINQFLQQLSEKFGLVSHTQIVIKKVYLSNVYFTTDKHLETLNPKLKEFSKYLADTFSNPYEVGEIAFWADLTTPARSPKFTFERAVSKPFSENRYFSTSGLQTEIHLELLNKLEEILSV